MLPPNCHTIDWLYNLGWEDANRYFDSRHIPPSSPSLQSLPDRAKFVQKVAHPYDVPRRVTMHRFLGYDFSFATSHVLMFFIDFVLLLFYLLFFKPMALMVIYAELCFAAISYAVFGVIYDTMEKIMIVILGKISLISHNGFLGHMLMPRLGLTAPSMITSRRQAAFVNLWECITCITSLSLFLRFLSFRPSNAVLRKHRRLERLSLTYRIFRHII